MILRCSKHFFGSDPRLTSLSMWQ